MPWLRKLESGKWSAQIDLKGVRKSQSFPTKAAASAWATVVEAEILSRKRGQIVRKTLRQALERYADEVSPTKRNERWERTRLAFLAESLGFADRWLEDVTPDHFGRWRDRQLLGVKGSTVNRDLNLLSNVLSRCRDEWGWLHASPLAKFKRPRNPAPRTRLIHWREIRAMLKALGWRRAPPVTLQQEAGYAFLMALHTAMRASEVLSFTLRDGAAWLPKTKNGDSRAVPMSQRAMRLHRLCPEFTITGPSLDALFRKARKRAGLAGFTYHDARATALTRLAKVLQPMELARMSGHRDLNLLLSTYYRQPSSSIVLRGAERCAGPRSARCRPRPTARCGARV